METIPANLELFHRFGIALAIGLLIGLQREYAYEREVPEEEEEPELFAGTRTFALMGLLGCTTAFVADVLAMPLVFPTLVAIVGFMIATAYFIEARRGNLGMTTEVAALFTLLIGTLCYKGYFGAAAALGVATTVLLALKIQTQDPGSAPDAGRHPGHPQVCRHHVYRPPHPTPGKLWSAAVRCAHTL